MQIGQLAKRTHVPIDTIRYYESHGILPAPARRNSGYRSYGDADVARLHFVRRAKALGFTLEEIRELLALSADRDRGVRGVKQRAEARLAEIEQRIRELQAVRRGLKHLIGACPGHGELKQCPILHALNTDEEST